MSHADFLRRLVDSLDTAGIPYMVTGSFASTVHGVPRSTHDIDLVIDPTPAQLDAWLSGMSPDDYYVDADVARDALRRRTMFNVIDMSSSWKADLVIRKDRPYSHEELSRRLGGFVAGVACAIATPEDVILAKLEWAKASGSQRQLDDVAGIVALQPGLDRAYVDRWAADLGVADLWASLRGP